MTKSLDEMFDDLVAYWHDNYDGMLELYEFMGISWEDCMFMLANSKSEEWREDVKESIGISYHGWICK